MDIQEQRQGAVTVLRPMGPLSQGDAEEFKNRFQEVLGKSLGRMAIDAGAVTYVDSRGLEVLLEASEELNQIGLGLRLCAVNETVREVLELTELADRFEFYEDVNGAIRSFL